MKSLLKHIGIGRETTNPKQSGGLEIKKIIDFETNEGISFETKPMTMTMELHFDVRQF